MATNADPTGDDDVVEVLLAGSDPEYLEEVAGQVTGDGVEVQTVATTDPEAAVERLDEGSVDCLVATYNPSANEGLPILDFLREESPEVPVFLLPSGPTTVVVSENLVVDVASVFTREEAVDEEAGLDSDDVVSAVEQRRADAAARRRRGLEEALESVARELPDADEPAAVDRELVEGMAETDEVDGAWMADVDGDEVDVETGAGETDAPPPADGPPSDAVKRALAVDQPQVTSHGDANYAAVPVTPDGEDSRVLTMASESRYAFGDEETRVLRDVGDTASRAIDDVAGREVSLGGVDDREAFETVLEQLSVPVVAYGDAGWVTGANEAFADLLEENRDDLLAQPVWDVLPSPNLETFEDYWASFSSGETRTQVVDLDAVEGPHQLVTTRVEVDDDAYNVTLAVEAMDEAADSWFADVLAYEFRHWVDIAQESMAGGDEEAVDAVVDRMQDAIESEVEAAKAGAATETGEIDLEEPSPADAAGTTGAGSAGGPGGGTGASTAGDGTGASAGGGGAGAGGPGSAGAGAEESGSGASGPGAGGEGAGAGGAGAAGDGAEAGAGAGTGGGGAGGGAGGDGAGAGAGSGGAGSGAAGEGAGASAGEGTAASEGAGSARGRVSGGESGGPDQFSLADDERRPRTGEGSTRTGRASDDGPGVGKEPQPVSGVARDAWMTVVGEFGEYEIRGDRQVLADETMLHRLFAHLFRTLFSYGNASGVDVGVTEDGFFVADDGSGVPHEERDYAEGETMLDAESGAGIQVARRLAERHGWSLDIEATEDGGTRFVVSGATIRS